VDSNIKKYSKAIKVWIIAETIQHIRILFTTLHHNSHIFLTRAPKYTFSNQQFDPRNIDRCHSISKFIMALLLNVDNKYPSFNYLLHQSKQLNAQNCNNCKKHLLFNSIFYKNELWINQYALKNQFAIKNPYSMVPNIWKNNLFPVYFS